MTPQTTDIRQNPTPDFIEQLRKRFPVESEVDAVAEEEAATTG